MPRVDAASLWEAVVADGLVGRFLQGAGSEIDPAALAAGSSLGGARRDLRGASVLLATRDPLPAALALIELDGLARRIVLCPPDLPAEHLAAVAAIAETDATVIDDASGAAAALRRDRVIASGTSLTPEPEPPGGEVRTEWILLTSGTTGVPKLVVHDLSGLAGPSRASGSFGAAAVWSTFYDIRRYGGLQILLRALLGGGSMVLAGPDEPVGDFLRRVGSSGVSHISGTPSHWRRALMSPEAHRIAPRYVRLSGEIADQGLLDQLRAFYPGAAVSHAFASTEAGVGFEVDDGSAGFPASLIGRPGAIELAIVDGSLRIRSPRTAKRYLGVGAPRLRDEDGFVDTGDMIERRGERYFFIGRRDGVINVGGRKLHPEEVEAVINRHPAVQVSRVSARPSPITGSLVLAEAVLRPAAAAQPDEAKASILESCRAALPAYKVPATLRIVGALGVASSGKLARRDA